MKKVFVISTLLTIGSVVGIILLLQNNGTSTTTVASGQSNVSVVDGKQVIQIDAKGGYAPRNTVAKANMPTTLNVQTSGTFDCSSALVIPSIKYRTNLPPSGVTPIEIPPQPAGTTLKGVCSMGMYSFAIAFE
jgi:plastocyanin domain-containing protein